MPAPEEIRAEERLPGEQGHKNSGWQHESCQLLFFSR